MSVPIRQNPEEVLTIVTSLSGIPLDTLKSPTQLRSVGQVRAAAVHLLRTHCRLPVKDVAPLLARSDQTVCECSRKARMALVTGGRIAELIEQIRVVLDDGAADASAPLAAESESRDGDTVDRAAIYADPSTLLAPRSIPAISLRHWRRQAGLTQPQLGARAGVARETIARIENGRPASWAVFVRLTDALQIAPRVLTSPPPAETEHCDDRVGDQAAAADRVPLPPPIPWLVPAVHLRRWRTRAGLTQPELAGRAGIARETIARIENGRPAWRPVLFRLAEALLIAPSMLTGTTDLDTLTGETYKTCNRCAAVRPLAGFIRIKDTPWVYLRCRVCRARDARERYYRTPEIHEAEKARAREKARVRRLSRHLGATQSTGVPGSRRNRPDKLACFPETRGSANANDPVEAPEVG